MSRKRRTIGAVMLTMALAIAASACDANSLHPATERSELRIGMVGSSIDEVQPYAQHGSISNRAIYDQLYEGLTSLGNDGAVVFVLAESMEPNDSLDVWTIHLRDGVQTHAGEDFTAEDAAASIAWMVDKDNAWAFASQLDFIDPARIRVVDDLTLELGLNRPYGPVPEAFSMSRILMRSVKGDATFEAPAGTGPFKLESLTPGIQAKMTRFDDYWGDTSLLDSLVFSFFQEPQAVTNAIRGDQIDVAQGIPFPEIPSLESMQGLATVVSDTASTPFLAVRVDVEPTSDPLVRQALRLVVDRERVVANAFGGFASVGNDYVARNSACSPPDVPQRAQDIEEAKRLLAEAGQESLELEIVTDGAVSGMAEMAMLFAEDAAQAGIEISVRKLDVTAFLNQWLEWPFFTGYTSSPYFVTATGHFLPGGSENSTGWDDPEYNSVAEALFATVDPVEQCEYISRLQTIEYERGGYIMPIYGQDVTVYNERVSGLQPDLYARTAYRLAGVSVAD